MNGELAIGSPFLFIGNDMKLFLQKSSVILQHMNGASQQKLYSSYSLYIKINLSFIIYNSSMWHFVAIF